MFSKSESGPDAVLILRSRDLADVTRINPNILSSFTVLMGTMLGEIPSFFCLGELANSLEVLRLVFLLLAVVSLAKKNRSPLRSERSDTSLGGD